MNNNTKRILLDLGIITFIIISLSTISSGNISTMLVAMVLVIILSIIRLKCFKIETNIEEKTKTRDNKNCKYCKSTINIEASVCPICKRNQSNANNPLLLIPIIAILLFFWWCIFSNNAPKSVKEVLCGIGIRHGEYCVLETKYEIEINFEN